MCTKESYPLSEPCVEVVNWELIAWRRKQYQNPGPCAFMAEGGWIQAYHTSFLGWVPCLLGSSCWFGFDLEYGRGIWPLFLLCSCLVFPMITPRYLNVHASYSCQMSSGVQPPAWPDSGLTPESMLAHLLQCPAENLQAIDSESRLPHYLRLTLNQSIVACVHSGFLLVTMAIFPKCCHLF